MRRNSMTNLSMLGLLLLVALCCATYWVGLSGGFVFDDGPNFYYIKQWLDGKSGLWDAIYFLTPNSPLDKRTLAMASFALSAWAGGGALDPYVFKLHNLILHCLTGIALYALARVMLARDQTIDDRRGIASLAIAGLWLLHPLHVSTVLYAVQRMAQLSAFFCVLGMWLYMVGRNKLNGGAYAKGMLCLFVGVPLLTVLAIQGKQNGAILPLLCLVLELAYFRQTPRPIAAKVFMVLFCAIPVLAVLAILALRPSLLMAGYAEYDFTWGERLLSQSRALASYARQFLLPHTPSMGLATDDFAVSRGLFSPPSTAISLFLLVVASLVAAGLRKHRPTFFAGWFIFLTAHIVESSFLPLELYYEHRNLLPSIGLAMVAIDLSALAGSWLSARGVRTGRVGMAVAFGVLLALAAMTHGRARVWSNTIVLFQSEFGAHPESYRAIVNYVTTASELEDVKLAYAVTKDRRANARSSDIRGRMYFLHAWLDCLHNKDKADPADLLAGIQLLPRRIEVGTFLLFDQIARTVQSEGCGAIDATALGRAYQTMADHASEQSDAYLYKAAFRTNAAVRYADAGHWEDATRQARLGWQPSTPPRGAAALVEILLVDGDVNTAQQILEGARKRRDPDGIAKLELDQVEQFLRQERSHPGWNRARVKADAPRQAPAAHQPAAHGKIDPSADH